MKSKKQRTTWVKIHRYPNGFFKAGVVSNTKWGKPFDVIAYHEYCKNFKGLELEAERHLAVDEALHMIDALAQAVAYYMEHRKGSKYV